MMSKKSNIKLKRFYKFSLAIFFILFGVSLGLILSELRYSLRHKNNTFHLSRPTCDHIDDFHQFVYLYDTKEKLEDYNKTMARTRLDELGLQPESPEAEQMLKFLMYERPLVQAGSFVVFASSDNNKFSVREQSSPMTLLSLESREQTKRLILSSLSEKDRRFPLLTVYFTYSEAGVFERGNFSINREGVERRSYHDISGNGIFDKMNIINHDGMFRYRLNDLTWELEGQTLRTEEAPQKTLQGPKMMHGLPPESPPMEMPSIKTQ